MMRMVALLILIPLILVLNWPDSKSQKALLYEEKVSLVEEWIKSFSKDLRAKLEVDERNDWQGFDRKQLGGSQAVYIAYGSRLVYSRSSTHSLPFKAQDVRHFLLGVRKGGVVYRTKAPFFLARPLSHEEFLSRQGRLQVQVLNGTPLYYVYFTRDKVQALLAFTSLDWIESSVKAESSLNWSFLWFLILLPLLFLFRRHISKGEKERFLVVLRDSLLLAQILSVAVLGLVFLAILESERFQIEESWNANSIHTRKLLEEEYQKFLAKAGQSMGRRIQSPHKDLLARFNEAQDYRLARFGIDGEIQIYPEKNNEFFHQLVVAVGPGVFDQQPWVRESKDSILSRFKAQNPVSPFVQKVLEVDRESQKSFHKDREAVYQDYNIGGSPHYFLYQMDRQDRETGYFLTVPVSTLVQEFLRSTDCHQILQSNGFAESTLIRRDPSYLSYELESPLMQTSLLLHVKKEKAFASLNQLQNRFLGFLCIWIVLTIAGLISLNKLFVSFFQLLGQGLARISSRELKEDWKLPWSGRTELGAMKQDYNLMIDSLLEKRQLSVFVADRILDLMSDEKGSLKPYLEEEAVVLFSDVRSFTSLSEAQDAQDVVQALNEYFQIWQEEISRSCGVIEKFIGDAVVAVFFKKTSPQYLNDSLQTSLNVQLRLKDWNKNRRVKGLFELKNGIGLSHGVVHLHVIGNEIKKHLVASSTALTRAEELEALSKKGMYSKIILDDPLVELLDQSPALHEIETGSDRILEWKQEV